MKQAQIEVTYSDHMGSDLTVVNAARQSFGAQKDVFTLDDAGLINYLASGKRTKEWEIFLDEIQAITDRDALKQRLIEYKREAQHWAPFGHPHLTLRLRMPVFLARQFVKHTVGGVWSEESRRYMDSEVEFYFEPLIQSRPKDIKQGAGGEMSAFDQQQCEELARFVSRNANETYKELLVMGQAPEQAREILTLNMMTGVTWTGSLLFWSRVCNQRLDAHAQSAANVLAKQVNNIIEPLFPCSWGALVGTPWSAPTTPK